MFHILENKCLRLIKHQELNARQEVLIDCLLKVVGFVVNLVAS